MLRASSALVAVTLLAPLSLSAQATDDQILNALRWRNIGPANMGGRIVDIEAVERDFKLVFLASASGGVWKSINAGTTWQPIFDDYGSASIGDVGLFQPNPDIVWVGTGEANNRNSVAWGDGIYKSVDGGATFEHKGLAETHQIARVVPHLSDPDLVYTCAIGHLWGYSGDRGLFKTSDGGEDWTKLAGGLPDDGKTGCIDLVMHPTNPDVLYAAFYHRLRQPWTFHSGGPNGGIFKSRRGDLQVQRWRRHLEQAHERPARGRDRAHWSRDLPQQSRHRDGLGGGGAHQRSRNSGLGRLPLGGRRCHLDVRHTSTPTTTARSTTARFASTR
jgi:hypothetical protein